MTPEQKLLAAYAVLILKLKQHDVAALYQQNQGQINTAVASVRQAIGMKDD